MAKTGYKFFFQSKVTVNLVWHGFRHIFADFLLTSAKFRAVKNFFGQKMEVYMIMNVPASFHLIWTKNKEMAGGGLMYLHRLFDPQKRPAFLGLTQKIHHFTNVISLK